MIDEFYRAEFFSKEVDRCVERANGWERLYEAQKNRADYLEQANKSLTAALQFYADRQNWLPHGHPQIDQDLIPAHRDAGQRARDALASRP